MIKMWIVTTGKFELKNSNNYLNFKVVKFISRHKSLSNFVGNNTFSLLMMTRGIFFCA